MDTSCLPRTVDLGECRCCGLSKKCRVINKVYDFKGINEVYWNMMLETFDVTISHVDNNVEDRLICATCVVRLRDAFNFKKQVKRCDENFKKVFKKRLSTGSHLKVDPEGNINNFLEDHDDDDTAMEADNDASYLNLKMEQEKTDPLASRAKTHKTEENSSMDCKTKPGDSLLEQLLLRKDPVAEFVGVKSKNENTRSNRSDSEGDMEHTNKQEEGNQIEIAICPAEDDFRDSDSDTCPLATKKREKTSEMGTVEDNRNGSLLKQLLVGERNKKTAKVKKKLRKKETAVKEPVRISKKKAAAATTTKKPHSKRRLKNASATDRLSYDNLINIVNHSHVCPFKNITANYYCFYCRDNFTDPRDLREHTGAHDPRHFESYLKSKYMTKLDITRLDCRICDAHIETLDELKTHIRSHGIEMHDAPDIFVKFRLTHPKVDCLECGESFLFIDKLMEHLPVHFGRHVCDQCGAAFIQSSSLESHIRAHSIKGKGFPCSVCGRVLCSSRVRKVHEMRVHAKKPVIDCVKCDEKFTTYNQRNKHLVAVHGDNRTIPCPYCGRVFDNRNAFRSHNMRVHVREEKFHCTVCFQKFILSKQLSKHKKRCHPPVETGVM